MSMLQDLRVGSRTLVSNPGFTAVAVAALALGIGLNSTVFTFVNAVLLRGLPFEDSHRIMHLENLGLADGGEAMEVSYRDYLDWREQTESFEDLGAADQGTMNVSDDTGAPERVAGAWITANSFPMLGQEPLVGRLFLPGEDEPGAEPVVILGYGLWQNRYAGDPDVLGKAIRVNEVGCTIVGVMPEGMKFPANAELWRPIDFSTEHREMRDRRRLEVFGRLAPDVSLEQARVEMAGIASRLEETFPDSNHDVGVVIKSYNDEFNGGPIKLMFFALMGAVGCVLLIACANVANLLLARSALREREIAVRSALGASRLRVVRQLLVESLLLGSSGGIIGLVLSMWGIRAFDRAVADVGKPYWIVFSLDPTVVSFFVAVCFVTAILFGLVPALHAADTDLASTLKEGSRGQAGGFRLKRATSLLIVAELALTMILLIGAGLMMRSFLNLRRLDVGTETADRLTMRLSLAEAKYPDRTSRIAFHDRLDEVLSAVPGVRSVAVTAALPGSGVRPRPFEIEGRPQIENDPEQTVPVVSVSPAFYETVGVRVLTGRGFTQADGADGAEVAIVDANFAERNWPQESPLGQRIRLTDDDTGRFMQVVGVIPPILLNTLDPRDPVPIVYVPYRQNPVASTSIVAHSKLPTEALTRTLREHVQAVDPDLPLYSIATMEERLRQASWPYRVFSTMFLIFALIALVLSSVGLYAVTSYGVSQRTQEIGVRVAFGAAARDILRLVLRQGLTQLAVGIGLGVLGALAVTRVLGRFMIGIESTDPITFGAIVSILIAVAVVAFIVPARRACRVDPVIALRDE